MQVNEWKVDMRWRWTIDVARWRSRYGLGLARAEVIDGKVGVDNMRVSGVGWRVPALDFPRSTNNIYGISSTN